MTLPEVKRISSGGNSMSLILKPSDLRYRYPRDVVHREEPKFKGKPDATPFNRDDLYEILPLLAAVMEELGRDDSGTLHLLEEILNRDLPRSLIRRDEVFDFLVGCSRDVLEG
jgi:hypothetical protein